MIPAHITRLMTFAQHGEPKSYAASDMMRADLEALILSAAKKEVSPLEKEYLAMRGAQHDHPACAIFRGGRCTCDARDALGVEGRKP